MDTWAKASPQDREALFTETAGRKDISPEIVEKDFWVCWILLQISRLTGLPRIIFKGGTSLSKVFGIIKRFSEDIDLVINRHELGFDDENDPANQQGTTLRKRTIKKLKAKCFDVIANEFTPKLKAQIASVIGEEGWTLTIDPEGIEPQAVEFKYPTGIPDALGSGYIGRVVRLELGCRGEQIPCEEATVTPYAAEVNPEQFEISKVPVSVISAERTFWEKITILHREYYRFEAGKPANARVFRHYDDVAVISGHERGSSALTKYINLLEEVAEHKEKFFREGLARYDLAKKGTLRLVPSEGLEEELKKDYERMREMYFGKEPDFDEVIRIIRELEKKINEG
jgi:hypothetical protein